MAPVYLPAFAGAKKDAAAEALIGVLHRLSALQKTGDDRARRAAIALSTWPRFQMGASYQLGFDREKKQCFATSVPVMFVAGGLN